MGLRTKHYPVILETWPDIDWFEAISENYMDSGGRPLATLQKIRTRYPVALHGIALSIGSTDPLNETYLTRLKTLTQRIEPAVISDHLCWSGVAGEELHDLLPLPFTEEALDHIVWRVERVQEFLGRQILLENVSTYVTYRHSVMPEWEFLSEVARRSGCGILLDLNNIYVNSVNHGFDPADYLAGIPGEFVGQFHLAGHTDMGNFLFDTHSRPIVDSVWNLYREALKRFGQVSTLIEWDEDIPEFSQLREEVEKAKIIYEKFKRQPLHTSEVCQRSTSRKGGRGSSRISLADLEKRIKEKIQPTGEKENVKWSDLLNPQGGEPGEKRLGVHAGGYFARVEEGLRDVYEAVSLLAGQEAFHALSTAFAQRHVSRDYNLSRIGQDFPEYLEKSNPLSEMPFLPELAKLEWRIALSFHAFDAPPATPAKLAEIAPGDWEKARIIFQPSIFLFSSAWPVLEIWKSAKEGTFVRDSVEKKTFFTLIGRRGDLVRCEPLDANQYGLVKALVAGKTLGEACAELAEKDTAEELPVSDWFARWVTDGLIQNIVILSEAK